MFKKEDINNLHSYSDIELLGWQDFEWLCKFILQHNEFKNIRVTRPKADRGIDLICYKNKDQYYVQCKHEKTGYHGIQPIEPIRALGGCMLRDKVKKGIFISILPYDNIDYKEANKMGIWLIGLAEIDRYLSKMNQSYKPI